MQVILVDDQAWSRDRTLILPLAISARSEFYRFSTLVNEPAECILIGCGATEAGAQIERDLPSECAGPKPKP